MNTESFSIFKMPAEDPHYGVDFYTPEQKREMRRKHAVPDPTWRDRMATAFGGTFLVIVWIGTLLVALVIGVAIIKWAIEELAR